MEINILLISPDSDDVRIIGAALKDGNGVSFRVQSVNQLPENDAWLADDEANVILLDMRLPDVRGFGALDRLLLATPQVPILVFCAENEEDLARQAVQRGAQDYILNTHFDSYSLRRALRNAIDQRKAEEALFLERERAQVALDSIGDAVVTIDIAGNVTYLNSVAEQMTGCSRTEAIGQPFSEVLRIVDGNTRQSPARNPMMLAIELDKPVGLEANSVLVRRDGSESAIEDSAAPMHSQDGSVIGAVMVFHDVTASRSFGDRMVHLAQHDFLTDLPNAVLLNERISQAIALARRYGRQLALLFVDLDNFKEVNDSRGHAAGDKLLQSVALRLQACLRSSDAVSRRGGDEFVVLLSEITQVDAAAHSARKILAALAEPHQIDGHALRITASIGISVYPQDGMNAENLLRCADTAMYRAKRNDGPGRWAFFE